MPEILTDDLRCILQKFDDSPTKARFLKRVSEGAVLRDKNKQSHFCVYFAAYELATEEVFIGTHIKSDLYLFNGGHLEEEVRKGVQREALEEWGYHIPDNIIPEPELLTIAEIAENPKYPCRVHFDLWHFFSVDKNTFNPDQQKLATEYSEIGWLSISRARQLVTDPGNIEALDFIEKQLIPASPQPNNHLWTKV